MCVDGQILQADGQRRGGRTCRSTTRSSRLRLFLRRLSWKENLQPKDQNHRSRVNHRPRGNLPLQLPSVDLSFDGKPLCPRTTHLLSTQRPNRLSISLPLAPKNQTCPPQNMICKARYCRDKQVIRLKALRACPRRKSRSLHVHLQAKQFPLRRSHHGKQSLENKKREPKQGLKRKLTTELTFTAS